MKRNYSKLPDNWAMLNIPVTRELLSNFFKFYNIRHWSLDNYGSYYGVCHSKNRKYSTIYNTCNGITSFCSAILDPETKILTAYEFDKLTLVQPEVYSIF